MEVPLKVEHMAERELFLEPIYYSRDWRKFLH